MTKKVYVIEERDNTIVFHWLVYMISGLADIPDLENLEKPIKFHLPMSGDSIQHETLDLLKPQFEYISDISDIPIVNLPGAKFETNSVDKVYDYYYKFLRDQILIKNNLLLHSPPHRYIYISRSKSHLVYGNRYTEKKRQIVNEDEVYDILKKYCFEFVYLEDLCFRDKIQLFQEAKCIVSPNGGALSFTAFANQNTQIIEIHCSQVKNTDQYYNIAKVLDIPIIRYTNVDIIYDGFITDNTPCWIPFNMRVPDLKDFENFIKQYL